MLKHLRVQNLSIIREVTLEFRHGLTAITGETGAGKSVLVDSLALLLGERADPGRIRTGASGAVIEALFDIPAGGSLRATLSGAGVESSDNELVLRREILPEGRSRAFVADRLVTLSQLRSIGELLVDLHGQHEHQTLLRPAEHLPILDRFADHEDLLRQMEATHGELREAQGRLESVSRSEQELARRIDMLRFQSDEIARVGVKGGEIDALRAERLKVRNRERIVASARSGLESLYEGESCALGFLDKALASARELAPFDARVADQLATAEEARLTLRELAEAMRRAALEEDEGPARLEEIEARLAQLEGLCRKYGPDEAAVVEFARACETELAELTSAENSREGLQTRVEEAAARCSHLATELSARRRQAARSLESAVSEELKALALESCDFGVEFRVEPLAGSPVTCAGEPVACTSSGWDRVEFLLRSNPGESMHPLARIASGGEISRIMLAIHLVLKEGTDVVRVFDEVDAGIGGKVAQAVGSKLKELGAKGQVICVTHLPQIASLADQHLRVGKRVRQGRTEVLVENLDRPGAVQEVARMLGGERISELALRHAQEMVERRR
jgi:DNA repair protein RecN (Recombination protein N)